MRLRAAGRFGPWRVVIAAAAALAMLQACAPAVAPAGPPVAVAPAAQPPDFPAAFYRELAAAGQPVLRVDPAASLIVVEVGRAGALAKLGHDHVVASRNVRGYVAPRARRADLYVALAELRVDEPALRAQAGFEGQPGEADIAGTRTNMLTRVLDADRHPWVLVRITGPEGVPGQATVDIELTLHGMTRAYRSVPVAIETSGSGLTARMSISGRLSFNQTDFGIMPYSVFDGALAVRDRLDLSFRIEAA